MARGIELLTPKTRELAEKLLAKCKEKKIKIFILDTYRSNAEQAKLYAQGRTAPGKIVTNAKPGTSFHNYRCAFDFAVDDDNDGQIEWNSALYDVVGRIGKQLGLTWGGDFKSIKGDVGHFQYDEQRKVTLAMLQKGYKIG